ncbi:putative D-lactate dehydrogenase [Aspergillus steynii IBT 23096]|uniref:Putative D-lactate dehydrogenase n=1 Tax=Aspergillus steynii IBT 23096 TaxID=1392250 RepID=A0A2I2GKC5_9EURO|nr:putative D-lactate dehydrogenase [Aspergillus steynii IBT 23096]PLB53335.1 putative D-lactate dehydrogenase [Aspergillus steynii IBT 23096]
MQRMIQGHQAVQLVYKRSTQLSRNRQPIQFIHKIQCHGVRRDNANFPKDQGLSSSWSLAAFGAGVVGSQKPVAKYADQETMLKGVRAISDALGPESVTTDSDDISFHSYSDVSTSHCAARPVAVVTPKSTQEVSVIARICSDYRIPMIPFAGGSSVEGNFTAPYSGISINFSQMNKIIAFHEDDTDVVIQPGVNWVDLNDRIKESGLFLPMDPSPTALIGGMVATNCSGTNAVRYVVLADGSVIKTRHRPRKASAGYNLNALFTGSEGTLGMITEITLKLAPVPETQSAAVATFPSVRDAVSCTTKTMRQGIPVAAVELMDEVQMQVINKNGGAGGRIWEEKPMLMFKFSGTEQSVSAHIERVEMMISQAGGSAFEFARTEKEMHNLWSARKEAVWAMCAQWPEGTRIWSTDVAVPLSSLSVIIDLSKTESSSLGLFSSVLGHVGDGNFHQAVMYDPSDSSQAHGVQECVRKMVHRAVEMEGTVSVCCLPEAFLLALTDWLC